VQLQCTAARASESAGRGPAFSEAPPLRAEAAYRVPELLHTQAERTTQASTGGVEASQGQTEEMKYFKLEALDRGFQKPLKAKNGLITD